MHSFSMTTESVLPSQKTAIKFCPFLSVSDIFLQPLTMGAAAGTAYRKNKFSMIQNPLSKTVSLT